MLPSLHSLIALEPAGAGGSPAAPRVFSTGSPWRSSGKAQNENPAGGNSLVHVPKQQLTWAAPAPSPNTAALPRLQHTRPPRSRTWDVGVTEAAWDPPLVHLQLQCIDFIYVTRDPADRAQQRGLRERAGRWAWGGSWPANHAPKLLLGPWGEGSYRSSSSEHGLPVFRYSFQVGVGKTLISFPLAQTPALTLSSLYSQAAAACLVQR